MAGFVESMATINSFIRTLLAVVVVGAMGAGSWYAYQVYQRGDRELLEKEQQLAEMRAELANRNEQLAAKEQLVHRQRRQLEEQTQRIALLNEEIRKKDQKIEKLDTALRLLKVNHRVAWLTVLDQQTEPDTGELYTTVQFVEVDDQGKAIDNPRKFRIKGDIVYIDHWVVKFDDKYVEQADIDRSTSLVLFRRLFGESQRPKDGFALDQVGTRPKVYGRRQPMSDFEKRIWNDFWSIANDAAKAKALGIRAAHGDAPSIKLQKGKSYKIELRASDGLSITPDDGPPPVPGKPAA